MRFMIIRKADAETEAGAKAGEELIEAMARYNEEMINAGVMVAGDGLHPSSRGARIRFSNGKPIITDGPFTEAKEMIAGYTLIQVASREEALEWVKRWPTLDGHGNVELELRQLYELEELGEGEGIEHHARLREQLAAR
jgi:PhnB protein